MEEANEKFYEEAAKAQTVEEVLELAQAHGLEATEEDAQLLLSLRESGEEVLTDEALEKVSGGGLHYKGHLIVTSSLKCDAFRPNTSGYNYFNGNCTKCIYVKNSGIFRVCEIS